MYTLAVRRDFVAQHFLVGGDWGPENLKHSHHYRVEVEMTAPELDRPHPSAGCAIRRRHGSRTHRGSGGAPCRPGR